MSAVKVVRSELDVLNTKAKVFGQFDPTMLYLHKGGAFICPCLLSPAL